MCFVLLLLLSICSYDINVFQSSCHVLCSPVLLFAWLSGFFFCVCLAVCYKTLLFKTFHTLFKTILMLLLMFFVVFFHGNTETNVYFELSCIENCRRAYSLHWTTGLEPH